MFLISIKYSFIASFPSIYVRLHVLMLHVYFARKIHLNILFPLYLYIEY